MAWNETVNYLSDKMDALLEEAREKGCCFAFDIPAPAHANYRKDEPIILWSDNPEFGFSVEEYQESND